MRKVMLTVVGLLVLVGIGHAADQTVLGKQLQVKDPKPGVDATKRAIVGQALEKESDNTIVGNPTVAGATLSIFTRGAISSSQTFPLPAGSWAATKTGFKYIDPKLIAGPVKMVQVALSKKHTFQLKTTVSGKKGGLDVVPPNPGTDACLRFEIAGGDRYDVLFPASPSSKIKKNDAKAFSLKDALVEGSCQGFQTSSNYVVSALDVPTNGSEAMTLGFDIDDKPSDGIDNQLGSVLGSFQALAPSLDIQGAFDRAIDQGRIVLLVDVQAASLTNANGVGVSIFAGTTDMTPAACLDVSDVICRQQFNGTGMFNVDPLGPTDADITGAITSSAFTGAATAATVQLSFEGAPIILPLQRVRAHLEGLTAAGWATTGSKLGGAITIADIERRSCRRSAPSCARRSTRAATSAVPRRTAAAPRGRRARR